MRRYLAAFACGCACLVATSELSARQLERPYLPNETLATGENAHTAVADLNGDGRLDLVSASNRLETFLGDGFGGFTRAYSQANATWVKELAVGDVQGDGTQDVVTLGLDAKVTVYHGDGLGGLTLAGQLTAYPPYSIAVGDVDADGRADLAVSRQQNHALVFLATAAGTYASPLAPLPTDQSPRGIALRDLSGDGNLDLACVAPSSGNVNVFNGDGHGGFSAGQLWFAGLTTERFTVDDLDDDGHLDLVCPRTGSIVLSVLFGLGGGAFANLQTTLLGVTPRDDATVVDLDVDGFRDVIVTDKDFTYLLRGGPPGALAAPVALPLREVVWDVKAADFDGDLDADLAIGLGNFLLVAENQGDGSMPVLPELANAYEVVRTQFGDVDGDGSVDQVDLVRGPPGGLMVRLGDGAGGFGAPLYSPGLGSINGMMRLDDFDGDGVLDAVVTDGVAFAMMHGNNTGAFAGAPPFFTLPAMPFLRDFRTADIDADGDRDLYVLNGSNPLTLRTFVNPGNGQFVSGGAVQLPSSGAVVSVLSHDLDQDGQDDATCLDGSSIRFGFANGAGGFAHVTTLPAGIPIDTGTYADVDGDGVTDLVGHRSGEAGVGVRKRAAPIAFQPPVVNAAPKLRSLEFTATDVDGDGFTDFVALALGSTYTEQLVVLRGTGTTALAPARLFTVPGAGGDVGVFDFSGDGEVDACFPTQLPSVGTPIANSTKLSLSQCPGEIGVHGIPCGGSGGAVPRLAVLGCAAPGQTISIELVDALGGSIVLLWPGVPGVSQPLGATGCQLHINPLTFLPVAVGLAGAGPGNGSLSASVSLSANIPTVTLELQAFVVDPGVTAGLAVTNAVTIVIR